MTSSTVSRPVSKKSLLMQQFISLLLTFRLHFNEINIYLYYLILFSFIVGKYFKQGNTIGSVLQYISTLILLFGDIISVEFVKHIAVTIAIINYIFICPTLFNLPEYKGAVGLKDNYTKRNNKQLYWAQWYPVEQKQVSQTYQLPWNHTLQINKMTQFLNLKSKLLFKLFKFFNSVIFKYKLTFAKGNPAKNRGVILFSHGRTATPFIYSSILKSFAREWKILSPQHSQVKATPYKDLQEIKRYRQIQVKQRAEEIIFLANKLPQSEDIVLMGHSYGCATVLEAYKTLHLSIRKRVSHIVLLDPWLFPLTQQTLQDEIVCPILFLANQHFVNIKDVFDRNKKFVKRHGSKLVYICWKGGDHLHQTDMPFITGTSLRKIKNAKDSADHLERNIQIIQMFLDSKKIGFQQIQKIRSEFGFQDLGIDYQPVKWNDKFNF